MLSVSLTVLVCVDAVLFAWFRMQMVSGYYELAYSIMGNADAAFGRSLSDARNMVTEWYASADGVSLRLEEKTDFTNHIPFINDVLKLLNSTSYLQSVFFVNSQREIALSVGSNVSFPENLDRILIERLEEENVRNRAFVWNVKSGNYGQETIPLLAIPMAETAIDDDNFYGMTVMNIDLRPLNKSIFSADEEEQFRIVILNEDGMVVANSNQECLGEDWSEKDWVQRVLQNERQLEMKEEGKSWEFLSVASGQNGYYIVAQTDYVTQIININYVFYIVFAVIVIASAVIIVMMLLVSKRIFGPFTSMIDRLRESELAEEMEEQEADEVAFLEHFYQGVSTHLETLNQKKEKDFIVKNLLLGNQRKEIRELLLQKGILSVNEPYYMILVFVENNNRGERLNMQAYDMLRNMAGGVLMSVLEQYGRCSYFEVGLRRMLFILSMEGFLEQQEQAMVDIVEKARLSVQSLSQIRAVAVVSRCLRDGGSECVNCFGRMNACLKTRYLLECEETILLPGQEETVKLRTEGITECLKQRDKEGYMAAVNSILKECDKLPYEMFLDRMESVAAAVRKAGKLSQNAEQPDREKGKTLREQIASVSTREELVLWLESLYDEAAIRISKITGHSTAVMMEAAVDYIRNNYDDHDLNVNLLADRLNISAAYFGKLFTEFTGSRTLDYILKVRMDKAGELLLSEYEKDIAQIAEAVGYSNSTYFTTAFKKYYGMTPSKYRDFHLAAGMRNDLQSGRQGSRQ